MTMPSVLLVITIISQRYYNNIIKYGIGGDLNASLNIIIYQVCNLFGMRRPIL